MRHVLSALAMLTVGASASVPAEAAQDPVAVPQTEDRLSRFERALAQKPSATEVLAQWCRASGDTAPPAIRAVSVKDEPPAITTEVRRLLGIGGDEAVGYRHVRLVCGDRVLSDARNWYVPARLTADMNHALATSDQPFGAVIAATGFSRETIEAQRGAMAGCPARSVLTHRALIRARDGEPLALVMECYQPAVLD